MSENTKSEWIPEEVYKQHLQLFPLSTVDLVVTHKDEILLVKRNENNTSQKNEWATPGGRIIRDETMEEAATRVLERETGIHVSPGAWTIKGVNPIILPEIHAITTVMTTLFATTQPTPQIGDDTSSEVRWFQESEMPEMSQWYTRNLRIGGFWW